MEKSVFPESPACFQSGIFSALIFNQAAFFFLRFLAKAGELAFGVLSGSSSACRQFFFQQLSFVQFSIFAAVLHQFFVRAAFDDASVIEDADQVGILHG